MRLATLGLLGLLLATAWAAPQRRHPREKPAATTTTTTTTTDRDAATGEVTYLDQAWSARDRGAWYWTSQGSATMSYDLFLALEVADGTERFRSDAVSERYGLIPERSDPEVNPDGLPIGLARTKVASGQFAGDWVGPTCAMCHTAQLTYQGKRIRIDGGASSALDYYGWLTALDEALQATVHDGAKQDRLVEQVCRSTSGADEADVRRRLARDAESVHLFVTRVARPPFATGPRMDALGDIHNQVQANRLRIPENYRSPDAPVKAPFVWNAPQSAWVQWSGVAGDPFNRNFTESLGVFSLYDLTSPDPGSGLFESTTDVRGLMAIELLLRRLAPPQWPERVLGTIDRAKAARGEKLFAQLCVECHTTWPYRWGDDRGGGARFIENALVPAAIVGTDTTQLEGITFDPSPVMRTGPLAAYVGGKELASEAELRGAIVAQLSRAAIQRQGLTAAEVAAFRGSAEGGRETPATRSYKAGPRDGVWATGPFLHNGSVPNLYELLLPAAQRSKTFYEGGEFDPVKVGVDTSPGPRKVLFDTGKPGNSNAGHSFQAGTGGGILGRELTDDERWALVEYLKSIPGEAGRVTPYGGPASPQLAKDDPTFFQNHHPY